MLIHLVRAMFIVTVLAFTMSYAFQQAVVSQGTEYVTAYILVPFFAAIGVVVADTLWRRKRLQVLSGLFFGILAGLVLAYVLTVILDMLVNVFPQLTTAGALQVISLVKVLLGVASVFLCVSFVLQTKDDFRFVIPYVEFSKQTKGARPFLLDTSVIIDGRIADIADTRILESQLVVPRFILSELQAIADSDDKLKRARGRRGLDILNRLQTSRNLDIHILDTRIPEVEVAGDTDAKLLALSRHVDGRVMTNDYNLGKIAQLRGVDVININDLANALKPAVLPGETLAVKIIKPGEEPGQGVGYLEDGTMVVAEQGRDHIGREIIITVTSALQTSAGRMIFGRLNGDRTFGRREKTT
ncbi:MAG: putative PIN and TRAM-domain containing protein precursor [Planctomycetes bacterium ADurb.Bin126]|nr:MAG: putative PIN and TRAM-domain containing protein precursor [Planctomycetes bacterium ADurb.Bin126]HOD81425.1 PIN/TRAM domain-containing protein [Phycisphaerae bacterium]HQL74729.1 PIN/TRAM domain-containing protein [Phycisphaerae bacterium]